jgi:hypothetical protein
VSDKVKTPQERAEELTDHYFCDDPWYQCPCATSIEYGEPVDLARCTCHWSERVARLSEQFREVEREALLRLQEEQEEIVAEARTLAAYDAATKGFSR